MDARELFCTARDHLVDLRDHDRRAEAKRELAVMRARPEGPSSHGGVTDPTRRIDDLIDFEERFDRASEMGRIAVERASALACAYAAIDPRGAAVLAMRYLRLLPWRDVAERAGATYDEARAIECAALDRIDSEGQAAILSGVADVTAAEDPLEVDGDA